MESHAAPRWQERPNEDDRKLTVEEMAALMAVGCRVARGRDWHQGWNEDGTPPGPGTVMSVGNWVRVKWDRTGKSDSYNMGFNGKYHLRLLAPAALGLLFKPCLDVGATTSSTKFEDMSSMLTDGRLAKVRGLVGVPCSAAPSWSLKVLRQVAPHLLGLELLSPLQQHLDAALAMPQLQSLELHCTLDAPLPVPERRSVNAMLQVTRPAAALRWLRCGVYPLAAALDLVRAKADSLEELQLVAASERPYGCPDLASVLPRGGLKKLRRLVLLRETAYGKFCRHDETSCGIQRTELWVTFRDVGLSPSLLCSLCDREEYLKLN